ncbi:hypothetical protein [Tianweitania sediminis]
MKSSTALPYSSSSVASSWIAANAATLSGFIDRIGPQSSPVLA